MVRKAASQDSTKDNTKAAGFSFDNIVVEDATMLPPRTPREEKPNPLLSAVQESLDSGKGKKLPPLPVENQKDADNYLRRAAVKLNCGVSVRPVDNGDGTVTVFFQAVAKKRARKYNVEDVRTWAEQQGWNREALYPKVPREISNAYREAHGMKVNPISE